MFNKESAEESKDRREVLRLQKLELQAKIRALHAKFGGMIQDTDADLVDSDDDEAFERLKAKYAGTSMYLPGWKRSQPAPAGGECSADILNDIPEADEPDEDQAPLPALPAPADVNAGAKSPAASFTPSRPPRAVPPPSAASFGAVDSLLPRYQLRTNPAAPQAPPVAAEDVVVALASGEAASLAPSDPAILARSPFARHANAASSAAAPAPPPRPHVAIEIPASAPSSPAAPPRPVRAPLTPQLPMRGAPAPARRIPQTVHTTGRSLARTSAAEPADPSRDSGSRLSLLEDLEAGTLAASSSVSETQAPAPPTSLAQQFDEAAGPCVDDVDDEAPVFPARQGGPLPPPPAPAAFTLGSSFPRTGALPVPARQRLPPTDPVAAALSEVALLHEMLDARRELARPRDDPALAAARDDPDAPAPTNWT
jgi:hypothetical protein